MFPPLAACTLLFSALLFLPAASLTFFSAPAFADEAQEAESAPAKHYLRISRNEAGHPLALQSAIARYRHPVTGATVDLIGAVHIGEASYYEELNKRFDTYDAVLYELVAESGQRPKVGAQAKSSNPVSGVQSGLKSFLRLEHQLERVDYRKPNFVHADLSPTEFQEAMSARGETIWTMLLRIMLHSWAKSQEQQPSAADQLKVVLTLLNPDKAYATKLLLAEEFEDMENFMEFTTGENGAVLIARRNERAIEVLQEKLAAGSNTVGIFYGAAHLPDLHDRLQALGFREESLHWIDAWSLLPSKASQ